MNGAGSPSRHERRAIVLVLGAGPAAAVSTRLVDGVVMAIATFVVLAGVSLLLPLVRRGIQRDDAVGPGPTAPPAVLWGALLISSCLTALVELALNALMPAESARLGIYVPLIAVSMLTMGRVDELALCPSPARALAPTLGVGAAYAALLVIVALAREVLGSGTITLGRTTSLGILADDPARAFGLAAGALICLGYLAAALRLLPGSRARSDGGER